MLYTFDEDTIPSEIQFTNASGTLVDDGSGQSKALRIQMDSAKNSYSGLVIKPDKPWNWSQFDDFSIAFDFSNQGEVSTQVYFDISDITGGNYTRSVAIPVAEIKNSKTFYGKCEGMTWGHLKVMLI